jgi:Leucine-rich repeat (LRR) protein
LQELVLFANQLKQVPDALFTINTLTKLDLEINHIKTLPAHLKQNKRLVLSHDPTVKFSGGASKAAALSEDKPKRNNRKRKSDERADEPSDEQVKKRQKKDDKEDAAPKRRQPARKGKK